MLLRNIKDFLFCSPGPKIVSKIPSRTHQMFFFTHVLEPIEDVNVIDLLEENHTGRGHPLSAEHLDLEETRRTFGNLLTSTQSTSSNNFKEAARSTNAREGAR